MYARVATFESDPANLDDAISMVRAEVESGETLEDLEGENAHSSTRCPCRQSLFRAISRFAAAPNEKPPYMQGLRSEWS